ncbi:hypothetical protein [uncultured Phenylobacterium sp.]|uniref:hypothetical protein n=1 Tax=uncultured Phenylobacterium sp. TaxID=349273 RepID=UPI0025F1DDF3|nr:hypothetical protein [uncultured Phenylobacterium sp.]
MSRRLIAAVAGRLQRKSAEPEAMRVRTDREIAAAAFDAGFYLKMNPDVAEGGGDPLEHFLAFGWLEGRDPTPEFSVRTYRAAFPEAETSGFNPFVHYLISGRPKAWAPEPVLGFRYEVIERLVPLEARVAAATRGEVAAGPRAQLAAALASSRDGLARLHITFSHDDFSANVGGLQLAIQREAARLAELGRDHLHLHPARPWPVVRTAADPDLLGVVWNGVAVGSFAAADIAAVLARIGVGKARSFAIHSLLGHAADETVAILEAAGLRAGVFWLHDFASVCAGFHLLRNDVQDCAAPPPDSAACGICLYGPWRARHASEHARLFDRLDLTVVSPSQVTLDLWRAASELRAVATAILPHATLTPCGPAPVAAEPRALRVAFAGLPAPHKGWPLFQALANRFAEDPRYEFLHLGVRPEPAARAAFQAVSVSAATPLAMRDALAAAEVDVVLVWAICRETFSFVAYEAAAAGCAVVTGPDSGNVAAFVEATGHGQVLADEAALRAAFETGEVRRLARANRQPMLYDLAFSALTLDLAEEPTA